MYSRSLLPFCTIIAQSIPSTVLLIYPLHAMSCLANLGISHTVSPVVTSSLVHSAIVQHAATHVHWPCELLLLLHALGLGSVQLVQPSFPKSLMQTTFAEVFVEFALLSLHHQLLRDAAIPLHSSTFAFQPSLLHALTTPYAQPMILHQRLVSSQRATVHPPVSSLPQAILWTTQGWSSMAQCWVPQRLIVGSPQFPQYPAMLATLKELVALVSAMLATPKEFAALVPA